jgi:hypothetical protein
MTDLVVMVAVGRVRVFIPVPIDMARIPMTDLVIVVAVGIVYVDITMLVCVEHVSMIVPVRIRMIGMNIPVSIAVGYI